MKAVDRIWFKKKGPVAEFCARLSDSIKYIKFLDQLSNYQLSKTDSTLQN